VLLARTVGTSLSALAGIALASYPLLVYTAIDRFGPAGIAVGLGLVCVARLVVLQLRGGISVGGYGIVLVCIGGVLLAAVSYWRDSSSAVLFYPVLVNAVLLGVFAASLWRPPTVIERIARIRDAALPPAAVVYTRRVTIVWSVFFVLNGAAALYTAVAMPLQTWALYNGFIAYLLIGALFVVELAVRSVWRARLSL
jgi:uncharacterized membrane protein